MTIVDIFPIRGRGLIVSGAIENGVLTVGDRVQIQRAGSVTKAVVLSIEAFRKPLQQAQKGDVVGVTLGGIESFEVQLGDVLTHLEIEHSRENPIERGNVGTTYRNSKYGFEIDLPRDWATSSGIHRIPVILSNIINRANILEEFSYKNQENLNIVVESMKPEIPPDINELIFILKAREMNYTDVQFGRISICGRVHACVSYVMNQKGWLKKYLVVLNGYGYALTASCPLDYRNSRVEETWDDIARSLRLLNPIDDSVIEINNSPQARHSIELMREQLKRQVGVRTPR